MQDDSDMESIIESVSSLILSKSEIGEIDEDYPKPFINNIKNVKKNKETRNEIINKSKNVNKTQDKLSTTTRSQNSIISNQSETVERLLDYKKKAQQKLADQIKIQRKKEEDELRPKPEISIGTKKLIQTKKYVPIYNKERLQQISSDKNKKMEKLREEVNEKRRQAEEESIANSIPSYKGSEITNVELCFDPNAIKSMVYKKPEVNDKVKITTEEEELKKCSFKPKTDKKSEEIFAQRNIHNKSVVERLTDYGKYQQEMIKEKTTDSFKQKKIHKRHKEIVKEKVEKVKVEGEEKGIDEFVQMMLMQLDDNKSEEKEKLEETSSIINKYIS